MPTMQERIDNFLNGEIKWSIRADRVEKLKPLVQRLTNGKYYTKLNWNGRYCHFYTKTIPYWKIRNSDLRQLKKLNKQFIKEELLKEKEEIEAKLQALQS